MTNTPNKIHDVFDTIEIVLKSPASAESFTSIALTADYCNQVFEHDSSGETPSQKFVYDTVDIDPVLGEAGALIHKDIALINVVISDTANNVEAVKAVNKLRELFDNPLTTVFLSSLPDVRLLVEEPLTLETWELGMNLGMKTLSLINAFEDGVDAISKILSSDPDSDARKAAQRYESRGPVIYDLAKKVIDDKQGPDRHDPKPQSGDKNPCKKGS